jgi:DNA-3-methyladenine glycosylase
MVLPQEFFHRSVLDVAPDLLGKFLVRQWRGREIIGLITEVEAYDGTRDRACHAFHGLTRRTRPMYGPPGRFYMYFVYGMHWMLNVVTNDEGYPAAVLVRGVREVDGPGRLTKHFHIRGYFNGERAVPETGMWFDDRKYRVRRSQIETTPRIGVDYAGPTWAGKPYRFVLNT